MTLWNLDVNIYILELPINVLEYITMLSVAISIILTKKLTHLFII